MGGIRKFIREKLPRNWVIILKERRCITEYVELCYRSVTVPDNWPGAAKMKKIFIELELQDAAINGQFPIFNAIAIALRQQEIAAAAISDERHQETGPSFSLMLAKSKIDKYKEIATTLHAYSMQPRNKYSPVEDKDDEF